MNEIVGRKKSPIPDEYRAMRMRPTALVASMNAYDTEWWNRLCETVSEHLTNKMGIPHLEAARIVGELLTPEKVMSATYKHSYGGSTITWANSTSSLVEERATIQAIKMVTRKLTPKEPPTLPSF